jgi:hypothetical protein
MDSFSGGLCGCFDWSISANTAMPMLAIALQRLVTMPFPGTPAVRTGVTQPSLEATG